MASDELVRRLILELSALRLDIQKMTDEMRLLRETTENAPSTRQESIVKEQIISNHDICNRLVLYLHYYHQVRVEAKKRGIRVNSLSRKSLFSIQYQRFCPNDFARVIESAGLVQTTFEKSFPGRLELHFKIELDKNSKLIPFFECALDDITPKYAAEAFVIDLDSCRDYAAYKPFLRVISDVLT